MSRKSMAIGWLVVVLILMIVLPENRDRHFFYGLGAWVALFQDWLTNRARDSR